jgi:hypothetical protein
MAMPDMPFNFDTQYEAKLKEEIDILKNAVLNGSCPDHSRYMWYTGQLQGVLLAERLFKELAENYANR